MKALARTRTVGGSLMVTVPREIVIQEGLYPGEMVQIEVQKARKSYFGACKGIGPFKKEDKLGYHD